MAMPFEIKQEYCALLNSFMHKSHKSSEKYATIETEKRGRFGIIAYSRPAGGVGVLDTAELPEVAHAHHINFKSALQDSAKPKIITTAEREIQVDMPGLNSDSLDNLIVLYASDHFIVHKFLYESFYTWLQANADLASTTPELYQTYEATALLCGAAYNVCAKACGQKAPLSGLELTEIAAVNANNRRVRQAVSRKSLNTPIKIQPELQDINMAKVVFGVVKDLARPANWSNISFEDKLFFTSTKTAASALNRAGRPAAVSEVLAERQGNAGKLYRYIDLACTEPKKLTYPINRQVWSTLVDNANTDQKVLVVPFNIETYNLVNYLLTNSMFDANTIFAKRRELQMSNEWLEFCNYLNILNKDLNSTVPLVASFNAKDLKIKRKP